LNVFLKVFDAETEKAPHAVLKRTRRGGVAGSLLLAVRAM